MENFDDIKSVEKLLQNHGDEVTNVWSDDQVKSLFQKISAVENNVLVIFSKWFPKIAAAAVILLAISTIQIYAESGRIDSEAIVGIGDITPDEAYEYFAEQTVTNE